MSIIGSNIKKSREKKGMTAKDLAKKSGMSEASLVEIENGRKVPNSQVIQAVSKVLGVTIDAIEPSYFNDYFDEKSDSEGDEQKGSGQKTSLSRTSKLNQGQNQGQDSSIFAKNQKNSQTPSKIEEEVKDTSLGSALMKTTIKIPVITKINPAKAFPSQQDTLDFKLEPVFQGKNQNVASGEKIYYQAADNSLSNSRILKGDLVLVLLTETIIDKDIVLAFFENKTLLRRIKRLPDRKVMLFPDNPDFEVLIASPSEIKIYGKAVRVEFKI